MPDHDVPGMDPPGVDVIVGRVSEVSQTGQATEVELVVLTLRTVTFEGRFAVLS